MLRKGCVTSWFFGQLPGGKLVPRFLLDEVGDVVPELLGNGSILGMVYPFLVGIKRPDSTIEELFGKASRQM